MGLLFAIQVAIEMGLQQVCFESDCNKCATSGQIKSRCC